MYNKKQETVRILRRINLNNYYPDRKYEHFEIEITIHDSDEINASERAIDTLHKTYEMLSLPKHVELSNIKEVTQ